MKKIVALMIAIVTIIGVSFAATEASVVEPGTASSPTSSSTILNEKDVTSTINTAGDTAKNIGNSVLNKISSWSLPFCAILVVWGAVQYFILGIRNLYRKRQGLLLMWGSMTFYVIALFASLIFSFMSGQ